MAGKRASPFAGLGLDKALLRSTQQASLPPDAPTADPASPGERTPVRPETRARTRAHKHACTDASTAARADAPSIEELYRQLQTKQHLASQTFRFRPEELAALDRIGSKLKGPGGRGLSKNDLVRLGLNWLLTDYEQNGEESVLAGVRARV